MNTYTKEQKNQYFQSLRNRWKESKILADNDEKTKAIYQEVINTTTAGRFSYYSFYFTLLDMQRENLEGLPYIDCKTFKGWVESGYKVKKGEKSKIDGLVWLHPKSKDENGEEVENEDLLYPKLYHLFHKTQVMPIREGVN